MVREVDFAPGTGNSYANGVAEKERDKSGESAGASRTMEEDEERDAVFFRLESLGYRVGQGLVERYAFPFPSDISVSVAVYTVDSAGGLGVYFGKLEEVSVYA